MTSIRIHIADRERSCLVGADELHTWSKALIDEILFEAAKQVSEQHDVGAARAVVNFRVLLDGDDGSIIIER